MLKNKLICTLLGSLQQSLALLDEDVGGLGNVLGLDNRNDLLYQSLLFITAKRADVSGQLCNLFVDKRRCESNGARISSLRLLGQRYRSRVF